MSKYKELLDRIDQRNYLTEREHREFLEELQEAINKAEKYDRLNVALLQKEKNEFEHLYYHYRKLNDDFQFINIFDEKNEIIKLKEKIIKLNDENKDLKQAIQKSKICWKCWEMRKYEKIYLEQIEHANEEIKRLTEENKILKEGIMAYMESDISILQELENGHYEFSDSDGYIVYETNDDETDKIKAMMEVVENEK